MIIPCVAGITAKAKTCSAQEAKKKGGYFKENPVLFYS